MTMSFTSQALGYALIGLAALFCVAARPLRELDETDGVHVAPALAGLVAISGFVLILGGVLR